MGRSLPYALNFDVMAHELGHLILYSTIGVPSRGAERGEYYGFQESGADTTALIAALHFESLIAHLLEETRGNLYVFNELDRFAELSPHDQIRLASNDVRLSQFSAGWEDEHALSQPLTGALFDVLVDIFQEMLVERGLIPREVAEATRRVRDEPERADLVQPIFEAAYEGRYDGFRAALIDARDYAGKALAETWQRLRADDFSYLEVAADAHRGRHGDERRPLPAGARRELRLARDRPRDRRPAPQAAGAEQPHPLGTDDHAGHGQRLAENELPRTGDRGGDCCLIRSWSDL